MHCSYRYDNAYFVIDQIVIHGEEHDDIRMNVHTHLRPHVTPPKAMLQNIKACMVVHPIRPSRAGTHVPKSHLVSEFARFIYLFIHPIQHATAP